MFGFPLQWEKPHQFFLKIWGTYNSGWGVSMEYIFDYTYTSHAYNCNAHMQINEKLRTIWGTSAESEQWIFHRIEPHAIINTLSHAYTKW